MIKQKKSGAIVWRPFNYPSPSFNIANIPLRQIRAQ